MKLLCYLKNGKPHSRCILLHESDNLDELKSRAVKYVNTNPSFRSDWTPKEDQDRQELKIEFDYRLVIQA
jgi:hypothetical protein